MRVTFVCPSIEIRQCINWKEELGHLVNYELDLDCPLLTTGPRESSSVAAGLLLFQQPCVGMDSRELLRLISGTGPPHTVTLHAQLGSWKGQLTSIHRT